MRVTYTQPRRNRWRAHAALCRRREEGQQASSIAASPETSMHAMPLPWLWLGLLRPLCQLIKVVKAAVWSLSLPGTSRALVNELHWGASDRDCRRPIGDVPRRRVREGAVAPGWLRGSAHRDPSGPAC